MARQRHRRARVIYPRHALKPEDLLHFVELKWFTTDWDRLGLPDEEFGDLQIFIMMDPKRGSVIPGTHGLRKLRFARSTQASGKSGGLRICYVYFPRFYTVLLAAVYAKGTQDDLPAAAKRAINQAIDEIEDELQRRFVLGPRAETR